MSIFGVVWLLIEVNLIGGTIFGFPALFKILPQYGIYGDKNNCSLSSLMNRTEIEIRELSFKAHQTRQYQNALTLGIILFEIPSVIIGPLIDRFRCRFVKLIAIFSSLVGIIIILLTAYTSSDYFSKSRAFVSTLFAGVCTSATILVFNISTNKYTFAFNLSTISAILICSLNGFLLEFKADKSKKQKLLNISLMQTISWLINIVTCIICMFVQKKVAIKWYTRDTFLFRLVNKVLREENIDDMYKIRLILSDIHIQLVELHGDYLETLLDLSLYPYCLTVYRGQLMSARELDQLKWNIGCFISMNSFLSTSTARDLPLIFSGQGQQRPQLESILFEITIETSTCETAFADIQYVSWIPGEEEILITIGAIFRIDSSIAQSGIEGDTIESLETMQRSLELHIASLPPGHPSIADMYDVIAWTHLRHGNVVDAQKAFETSIELRLNATYFNSVHLGHTYIGLGILLGGDEGMSYLDKAHCLFKEHLPQNNSKFIQLYMSKAEIHITKSEIQQAQSYLADALKIEQLKRSRPGKGTAHIFTLFGMSYLHED
ncbi:unnamed protein product, partial [Rotaria sordida]